MSENLEAALRQRQLDKDEARAERVRRDQRDPADDEEFARRLAEAEEADDDDDLSDDELEV